MSEPYYDFPGRYMFDGIALPFGESMKATMEKLKAGEVPDSDVVIATYPRSGTAKIVQIVWQLLHKDLPVEKKQEADEVEISARSIFVEACEDLRSAVKREGPIIFKVHLPFGIMKNLVEQKRKIIVGLRNAKDTIVSNFHLYQTAAPLGFFKGNWNDYFELVKAGGLAWGNVLDWHCSWWSERYRDNILIVTYEDLSKNPNPVIKNIAAFLDIPITSDEVELIANSADFETMKANPKTNYTMTPTQHLFKGVYMRQAVVGGWKDYFTDEQNAYMDAMYENKCVSAGLRMKFEL